MKRISFLAVVGILALTAFLVTVRGGGRPAAPPLSNPVADFARRLTLQQEGLNLLQEKVNHLTKLIENVAANNGQLQALTADSPDSLEHKLSILSGRVDSLASRLADASRYGAQIDRSLLGIDMKMSTPAVLNDKLDRLRKGMKP
jgi:uncharacterized phage infection (PIP) family protein YhgE